MILIPIFIASSRRIFAALLRQLTATQLRLRHRFPSLQDNIIPCRFGCDRFYTSRNAAALMGALYREGGLDLLSALQAEYWKLERTISMLFGELKTLENDLKAFRSRLQTIVSMINSLEAAIRYYGRRASVFGGYAPVSLASGSIADGMEDALGALKGGALSNLYDLKQRYEDEINRMSSVYSLRKSLLSNHQVRLKEVKNEIDKTGGAS
ncbi:MAG TPA: hypothetical protein PLO90_03390 [Clostridia bacterium]|nr:hypothetical protein [Clostridia bacterium]HPY43390.1 hypothetical protein [Clostridia bacterium]HQO54917.1 hypothetical protein [Clostridia bacterium]